VNFTAEGSRAPTRRCRRDGGADADADDAWL
jgi:hypothetical protein